MSQCRAHSRAVVFHTLHVGQRDTRLCTYLINCTTLYLLPLSQIQESSILILLLYSSIPSSSASAAAASTAVSLAPDRSITSCSHHLIHTCAPPASSPSPHTGPESVMLQYTARLYYSFTKSKSPSDQTLPPLLPPPLRFTPVSRPASAVESTP